MACPNKLTEDIINSCDTKPKAGVAHNSNAVLINYNDIDFTATTVTDSLISDLVLKSGATGYKFEYVKQLAGTNSEYAPDPENISGHNHNFLGRMLTATQENIERSAELSNGRYVAVVEMAFRGVDGKDKYKVYGFESGLDASEITYNSNENSASILFTLTTPENAVETYLANTFHETDEQTTDATFESLFASV